MLTPVASPTTLNLRPTAVPRTTSNLTTASSSSTSTPLNVSFGCLSFLLFRSAPSPSPPRSPSLLSEITNLSHNNSRLPLGTSLRLLEPPARRLVPHRPLARSLSSSTRYPCWSLRLCRPATSARSEQVAEPWTLLVSLELDSPVCTIFPCVLLFVSPPHFLPHSHFLRTLYIPFIVLHPLCAVGSRVIGLLFPPLPSSSFLLLLSLVFGAGR